MKKEIISFFERHPKAEKVYECLGRLFHTHGAAQSLGGEVTTHSRPAPQPAATNPPAQQPAATNPPVPTADATSTPVLTPDATTTSNSKK